MVFGFDAITRKLYCFYPDVAYEDQYAQSYIAYNMNVSPPAWERGRLAVPIVSMGDITSGAMYTCDGKWASTRACDDADLSTWTCQDAQEDDKLPDTCMLSSNGKLYKVESALRDDSGTNIRCLYETKDITINDGSEYVYFSPIQLSFNATNGDPAASNTVSVYYSTDAGTTWTEVDDSPITLAPSWTTHHVELGEKDVKRIRFRFVEESADDFQLSDMVLQYAPSTYMD